MNFQSLKKIESYEFYLDVAFRKASKKAKDIKSRARAKSTKAKQADLIRFQVVRDKLNEDLFNILKSYPSIDSLAEFYQELIKCTLDYPLLKKSLGAVNWAIKQLDKLHNIFKSKIKNIDSQNLNSLRKQYYGRVSSVLKQISKNLEYLETCRKIMRGYPAIKTNMYTVCLFGFPNAGKSTLLTKLTRASPEINSYPFTTKKLNLGYIKEPGLKIQIIDAPGTLNRINKMNNIELQAHLALKYLAALVVFVFDPTFEYSYEKQVKLLNRIKKTKKQIIIYMSKMDIAPKTNQKKILRNYDAITDYKLLIKRIKAYAG